MKYIRWCLGALLVPVAIVSFLSIWQEPSAWQRSVRNAGPLLCFAVLVVIFVEKRQQHLSHERR